jgi:hypothetical protein
MRSLSSHLLIVTGVSHNPSLEITSRAPLPTQPWHLPAQTSYPRHLGISVSTADPTTTDLLHAFCSAINFKHESSSIRGYRPAARRLRLDPQIVGGHREP